MSTRTGCPACDLYALSRGARIRAEIAKTSNRRREREARWARFMDGVHERHLEELATRALRRFAHLVAAITEDAPADDADGRR